MAERVGERPVLVNPVYSSLEDVLGGKTEAQLNGFTVKRFPQVPNGISIITVRNGREHVYRFNEGGLSWIRQGNRSISGLELTPEVVRSVTDKVADTLREAGVSIQTHALPKLRHVVEALRV